MGDFLKEMSMPCAIMVCFCGLVFLFANGQV